MEYFTRMTTATQDPTKKNVVLMGRKTWDCIPHKYKPLANRINFVLSRNIMNLKLYKDTFHFKSLDEALAKLQDDLFKSQYEKIWVIGGSNIYKLTMDSKHFYRLYLTEIKKVYECDTFFPKIDNSLQEIKDPTVPNEEQEENGVKFQYKVYQNPQFDK
ncbi:dihydrofolate reductase isoform X2 [Agrilus planipennis]|nr:dihydrofolate reductase isoform X2 [Agrilus planipennis]XP_025831683.1 dihydrofolate reductase isoform X2 [Agrilus planipennis]